MDSLSGMETRPINIKLYIFNDSFNVSFEGGLDGTTLKFNGSFGSIADLLLII